MIAVRRHGSQKAIRTGRLCDVVSFLLLEDIVMHLATKTRPKTLHEAWLRAIGFRLPVLESMERLFEEWTRFRDVFLVCLLYTSPSPRDS